jgi:hypothetical protein
MLQLVGGQPVALQERAAQLLAHLVAGTMGSVATRSGKTGSVTNVVVQLVAAQLLAAQGAGAATGSDKAG